MIEAFRIGVVSRGATLWDGLDGTFEDGSATVIVGPPSCGKTLFLSILRGEKKPDAGDVLVSGESLYRTDGVTMAAFRAICGFVPERCEADGRLTVGNLFARSSMVCSGVAFAERKDRQEQLLAMIDLTGKEDARLSTLSSSERARVVLATELLRGPKVLFTDGVIQAIGPPYVEMMGNLFRMFAGAGNLALAVERRLPVEWEEFATQEKSMGPFLVYRLSSIVVEGGSD